MDEIRFDILNGEFGDVAVPIINGRSLISVLREIEMPFAKLEDAPEIAGAYVGLLATEVFLPSKHFLLL